MRRWYFPVFLAVAILAPAAATTLQPLSEDEQIQQAATIFRGRADRVDAARETTSGGSAIVTTVRFTPLAVYKGEVPGPIALRFLGGKVGDVEMKVDAMPRFEAGQDYILFVSGEGNRACPVVGWSKGSLKVDRATGTVAVSSDVAGSAERAVAARSRTGLKGPTKLADFEGRLRERVAELGKKP